MATELKQVKRGFGELELRLKSHSTFPLVQIVFRLSIGTNRIPGWSSSVEIPFRAPLSGPLNRPNLPPYGAPKVDYLYRNNILTFIPEYTYTQIYE